MKKLLYVLPILAVLITSCTKENAVTGKLSNSDNDGKQIFLFESHSLDQPYEPVDSVIIKNGSFSFKRKATETPTISFLAIKEVAGNTPEIIPFINENGSVEIIVDSLSTIKGTPMNDDYQNFINDMRVVDKEIQDLSMKASLIQDQTQLEPFYKQLGELQTKQSEIVYNYIKANISNKVGEFSLVTYASILDLNKFKELLALTSPELQKEMAPMLGDDNDAGVDEKDKSFVGKQYINVTGVNPEGKKIALSDYVGKNKLVLIDFWASWCGPCVKEMPNVVETYNMFKNKGFEVVGISLDEEKSKWVNAIQKLNMTWPQISDLKGWDSDLSAPYKVKNIPFTLLVDQDGKVIAENLRGKALIKKIEEVLK